MKIFILVGNDALAKKIEVTFEAEENYKVYCCDSFSDEMISKVDNGVTNIISTQTPPANLSPSLLSQIHYISSNTAPSQINNVKWTGCFQELLDLYNIEHLKSKYVSVKIFRFLKANSFNCDMYLKLSEKKFIKIWNKEDLYSKDDIQKYIDRGCSHFYIKRKDFKSFTQFYLELFDELQKYRDKEEDILIGQQEYLGLLHDKLLHLKIDEETIKQTDQYINQVAGYIEQKSTKLGEIFKSLLNNPSTISNCSVALCYLLNMITDKLGWNSPSTIKKLVIASVFHDITLLERPDLFEKSFAETDEIKRLPYKDRKMIFEHPARVVEMVNEVRDFMPDVASIILSHHESPTANGYPQKLSSLRVTQVAAIFIVCEFFLYRVLQSNCIEEDIQKTLQEMNQRFNTGNYKKVLTIFNELF